MKKLLIAILLLGSSLAGFSAETLYFSALVNVETKETINPNSGYVTIDLDRQIITLVLPGAKGFYSITNIKSDVVEGNQVILIDCIGTKDHQKYHFFLMEDGNITRFFLITDVRVIEFLPQ